jgi:hypothetical protein
VSVGYTFSKPKIGNVQFPEIRLYASCYNAFYLTKYRGYTPEQRGVDVAQYPSARSLTIGANFNF